MTIVRTVVSCLIPYRELIWQLTWREAVGKYRGSFAGVFWAVLYPIMLLLIYTFVFTRIFHSRWIEGSGVGDFTMALFVGLILHGFLSECMMRAPTLVLGNPGYVTKVVFPLQILPLPVVGAAFFHALLGFLVLLVAQLVMRGGWHGSVLLLPFVLAPLVVQGIAWGWLLSAVAVYVRDITQVIGLLTTALMFLSPVFYPLSSMPAGFRGIARLNPLTVPIEAARNLLLWGIQPRWMEVFLYSLASLAFASVAYMVFQKLRRGFADVM